MWWLVFCGLKVNQGQERLVCELLWAQAQELLGCFEVAVRWWLFGTKNFSRLSVSEVRLCGSCSLSGG